METISIALICTVGGFILSYAAFMRNKDNAIRAETKESAFLSAKLDFISQGVNNIQVKMDAQDKKTDDINARLIRVEERSKSNTHRLDKIEGVEGDDKNEN